MDKRRRLEQLASSSLMEECPDADQLTDYILGTLTGNAQLAVAAHVRACPFCQRLVADHRALEPRDRPILARLVPLPLLAGQRSTGRNEEARQYAAADLMVTLTVASGPAGRWRLTGRVLRAGIGQAGCKVVARAGRRQARRRSDDQGFFMFEALHPGTYTFTVIDEQVQVQINDIGLGDA